MVGTGYVGLVSGTCFAELGHQVLCIDINEAKIAELRKGNSPIYEPGLSDMLKRNISMDRIAFSTDYRDIANSEFIFLAVDTPPKENGEADLSRIESAAKSTAQNMKDGAIIVLKSTVPVGTHLKVKKVMDENTDKKFHVVNNPEFLKEGSAIDDFMRPDRVVVGFDNEEAGVMMEKLYAPLLRSGNPLLKMSNLSAEMTKYAANCFLATKISFINEIANLCDATGADIEDVRRGITTDPRIGKKFLYPGIGYGGSCFPKDVQALIQTGAQHGCELEVVGSAHRVNYKQKTRLFDKMKKAFGDNLKGKVFAFWGVAFKPNTDDIREAPAIDMAESLIQAGASVQFFDPVAMQNFESLMSHHGDKIKRSQNKYHALEGADGLVLLTEWLEFRAPDWHEVKSRLKNPSVFDGRNIYDTHKVLEHGLEYHCIGKHVG